MDDFATRLLAAAQEDFPLDERPFLGLAERLDATEQEITATFERLQREGVIRELSAFFDPRKLGYESTLACLSVPEQRVDEVAALLAELSEITHNYLRDHELNIWFTVIARSRARIDALLREIERQTGLGPIHDLPAQRVFKLRVMFPSDSGAWRGRTTRVTPRVTRSIRPAPRTPGGSGFQPDSHDWPVIEELQQGLPLCPRPFAQLAEDTGISEAEFIARIGTLLDAGAIRRLGPRVRHHRIGVRGNIMVVWRVPGERADEVGRAFAASEHVSHCYVRPPFEGFPYNLYTMVHGPDTASAEQVVADLARMAAITDYVMLHTVRELKKSTPVYRRPQGDRNGNG